MPTLNKSLQGCRILVIRLGAIGDVLLTTPFLRVLKETYPNASIDYVVKEMYTSLLEDHPYIDHLYAFSSRDGKRGWRAILKDIQQNNYDLIVDLQNNLRSRTWSLLSGVREQRLYRLGRGKRFLMVYGRLNQTKKFKSVPAKYIEILSDWNVQEDSVGPEIFISDSIHNKVDQKIEDSGVSNKKTLVLLAPGASKVTKRWPFERYVQVANYYLREGMEVGLIGGKQDTLLCQKMSDEIKGPVMNLTGECSLLESAAAIQRADVLVTNDTGMMHMATAVSTPVVAIFGPTSRHFGFFPYQSVSEVVEKEIKCRPCSYHGSRKCPKGHFKCMLEIKPEEIIQTVNQMLNQ